jgi:hypothetical protein
VRTAVADREELATKIEDADFAAHHLDDLALARRDLIDGPDDMTSHQQIP